ncbi:hypothetical protein C5S53_09755 [Methanophagales archaeon]|nr:hypothetical protein C5S53_09755 [Methanophagales archaeon]
MNKNNLKLAVSIPEAFAAAAPDDALPSGDPRYVELFIEQSEFLKSPSCHIVYTVPISLLAEENIAQVFPDDPVVIPMVEVYKKPL